MDARQTNAHELEEQVDELLELVLVRSPEPAAKQLLGRRLPATLYRRIAGGIPPAQLQALAVLAGGDMRMCELAHRLGLATSTVTRLVDRLEATGLAERRRDRPDRRSILVGLSRTGQEALHAARQRLRTLLHELLSGLAPHERGELLRLLTKLGEAFILYPPEPEPVPVRARSRAR